MLKFCLTIDCEKLISFRQGNPEWNSWSYFKFNINNLLKKFRYNKNGFSVFYSEIKKQKFPCTFMLVEKLFRFTENYDFIEWGSHTINHLPLNLVSDKILKRELVNNNKNKSITCPMWRVEDRRNPSRIFEIMKKNGFTHTVYHGFCNGRKTYYKKLVKEPEERFGIKCVSVSNYLEGNFSRKKMKELKKDILKNVNRDGVYLLTTHDFTHRNNKNLKEIIQFVKNLKKDGKIKIVKLGDL